MKNYIDLTGEWKFQLDHEQKGLINHFEKIDLNDTIALPNTTSHAKKGELNPEVAIGHLTDTYKTEDDAWFSKDLQIDSKDIGKTAILTLERTKVSLQENVFLWHD